MKPSPPVLLSLRERGEVAAPSIHRATRARVTLGVAGALLLLSPMGPRTPSHPLVSPAGEVRARDGQRDFDWEIGTWRTHLRLLRRPLSGSTEWVEYEGSSVVTKVMDGRANLVELDVQGPAGRIEGLSLRLYMPEARQWSLNFASIRDGRLSPPVIGEFREGRGEFHGQDWVGGRAILVRFVISDITESSARFEQAFSDDGGRTWEVNWIAVDTRVGPRP